jgi:hypothetical protein
MKVWIFCSPVHKITMIHCTIQLKCHFFTTKHFCSQTISRVCLVLKPLTKLHPLSRIVFIHWHVTTLECKLSIEQILEYIVHLCQSNVHVVLWIFWRDSLLCKASQIFPCAHYAVYHQLQICYKCVQFLIMLAVLLQIHATIVFVLHNFQISSTTSKLCCIAKMTTVLPPF